MTDYVPITIHQAGPGGGTLCGLSPNEGRFRPRDGESSNCSNCLQEMQAKEVEQALTGIECGACNGLGAVTYPPNNKTTYQCDKCNGTGVSDQYRTEA